MKAALALLPALSLCACAGVYADPEPAKPAPEPIERPVQGTCDASLVQQHIGETVTQELGRVIREKTGAQRLRWGPPNSAWTMDYREERVNVRYDAELKITAITCG
ncbi:I78 family peptidase inhibitor [Erythrobacter sp. MTPC3]|uniref:I78 family peptidase inhibitor n=1 Tax=Erythrobacter sp. MTPC3 TaxID=3056564 RepID=UPI0036F285D7